MYILKVVGDRYLSTMSYPTIEKVKHNIQAQEDLLINDCTDFDMCVYKDSPIGDPIYKRFYCFHYDVLTEIEEFGSLDGAVSP